MKEVFYLIVPVNPNVRGVRWKSVSKRQNVEAVQFFFEVTPPGHEETCGKPVT
jgi:hypothetical protein